MQLIDDYGTNGDDIVTALVDLYDWYIIPVMNPDGYTYTWQKVPIITASHCLQYLIIF